MQGVIDKIPLLTQNEKDEIELARLYVAKYKYHQTPTYTLIVKLLDYIKHLQEKHEDR